LKRAAEGSENLLPYSIEAAKAGVTTGEWADALRQVFGEYRAPTGLGAASQPGEAGALAAARERVRRAAEVAGVGRLRMLVGKPGLDGHSNAAEQVAIRARDAGFEVVYQGIRLTPEEIAQAAADEDVQVVGLSILSGSHTMLVPEVIERMWDQGIDTEKVPVVVGGVIPAEDALKLRESGVARVFTPREHDITAMVAEIADLIAQRAGWRE
jgi:(2R)-ethylmalonyl-CoA mutase